jgi:hypothetical protein
MITAQRAEQLNNRYSAIPRAYLGKSQEGFLSNNGRMTATKIMTLGMISTELSMYGSLNAIPYTAFMGELNISRGTTCRNLDELNKDGFIRKVRRSHYEVVPFASKSYIPVYHFLMEEQTMYGGRQKYLTKNAVLYLSELIAFYLNPKNKGNYFVGGQRRCAKVLNVADSTAWYVINELLQTRCIYRNSMYKDSAGNQMIDEGKGINAKCTTVYIVNGDILTRCAKINQYNERPRALRKLFNMERNQHKKTVAPVSSTKKTLIEGMTETQMIAEIKQRFAFNIRFKGYVKQLKQEYTEWLGVKQNGSNEAEKISAGKCTKIVGELKQFLISQGLPPETIPKGNNIIKYLNQF